jgi:hypothetical protein
MKIYINNFNIDILQSVTKTLTEYYINSETYIQIYSEDGLFQINEHSTKKQNIVDKDIEIFKEYYENFTLISDPSYYTLEQTYNIPSDHLSTKVKRCFFTPDKKSIFKLVIEGTILEENNKQNHDYNFGIHPYDIYIEVDKDKYQTRNNQDRNKKDPNTEKKDQNKNKDTNDQNTENTELNLNDELVKQEIIVFLSLLN